MLTNAKEMAIIILHIKLDGGGIAMYIKRHMEDAVKNVSKMFGSIMVTGFRQAGKTTLLNKITEGMNYATLDDPILLAQAVNEPGTFFKDTPPPVFVDEIQYAPNLFPYIKMHIDAAGTKGQFFLSGSQQFHMMKNVSESLAGRIGILNLSGISLRELNGIAFNKPFIPTQGYFNERRKELRSVEYKRLWGIIHRGSMPELMANNEINWQNYYASYTRTYIERDVRELTQVGDEVKFFQFLAAAAAVNGSLLNIASLSREIGISQPTAERWLSILQTSNIIHLLRPYHNNLTKRAIKTPKVYFTDTGLAAYLTKWPNPEVLSVSAQAGSFFETFVITEIFKSYYNAGVLEPPLYFFRDKEQNEIDLIIQEGDTLHPIEIKKYADPRKEDIKAFRLLDNIPNVRRGSGGVICMYDKLLTLKDEDKIIPVSYL
jgi:uncharacterized protein